MSGWKTKTGALLVVAAAVLKALGLDEWAAVATALGAAFATVGIGHKIEKAAKARI